MNHFPDLSGYSVMPKVLGISGSPRKKGNSDILLDHILKGVQGKAVPYEKVHLADYQYSGCIGCEKCRKDKICTGLNDGMSLLYPEILQSKGLVLVSPTHNYNITAWMKAFIDRLYCFYNFNNSRPRGWSSQLEGQKRKAVLGAICEQQDEEDMGFTLEAMRRPLTALGYDIIGELAVLEIFDKGGIRGCTSTLDEAVELGKALAESIA